jgi:hypothetical protein
MILCFKKWNVVRVFFFWKKNSFKMPSKPLKNPTTASPSPPATASPSPPATASPSPPATASSSHKVPKKAWTFAILVVGLVLAVVILRLGDKRVEGVETVSGNVDPIVDGGPYGIVWYVVDGKRYPKQYIEGGIPTTDKSVPVYYQKDAPANSSLSESFAVIHSPLPLYARVLIALAIAIAAIAIYHIVNQNAAPRGDE